MRHATILLFASLLVAGCKQNIGASCSGSIDCSRTGERQCDLAQPGGYCTVFACDPDTCPQGACVEWRFTPSRTAQTWCMKTCNDTMDCRAQYTCVFPSQITANGGYNASGGETVARIVDLNSYKASAKICVALAPGTEIPPPPDAGL